MRRTGPDHSTRLAQQARFILPVYDANTLRAERAAEAAAAAGKLRGADLEAVARDTNLKEETVRRVVDRLLAEAGPEPGAAVSNG